jgi:hypothetical protein
MDNNNLFVLDFFILKEIDFRKVFTSLEHFALKRKAGSISIWLNPEEGICKDLRDKGYREKMGSPYTLRVFAGSNLSPEFFLDHYCYRQGDYDAA